MVQWVYFHCCLFACFIWVYMTRLWGWGLQRVPLWENTRGCPPYLTEPVPSGSKTDPLLPKDGQQLGGQSKKTVGEINLQTLRSMKKEVEGTLQIPPQLVEKMVSLAARGGPTLKQGAVKEAAVYGQRIQEQELWLLGKPPGSSLVFKAHTLWKGSMYCLERNLGWPRLEYDEEEAADTKFYQLTATPISYPLTPLIGRGKVGRSQKTRVRKNYFEFGKKEGLGSKKDGGFLFV